MKLSFWSPQRKIFIFVLVILFFLLLLLLIYLLYFSPKSAVPLLVQYDLQSDYCGKAIDYNYCRCAFDKELSACQAIGSPDPQSALMIVQAGFQNWLKEKKEEVCLAKGGRMIGERCFSNFLIKIFFR